MAPPDNGHTSSLTGRYHPDQEINAEIAVQAAEGEEFDVFTVGYPPRRWQCGCGASHDRGHYQSPGVHRCLRCGYVGTGGALVSRSDLWNGRG